MRVSGGELGGEARGARNRSGRGGHLSLGEHAAKAVVAGAALIADAAALQLTNGGNPVVDDSGDFPIGFTAADADDHWLFVPWTVAFETQSQPA